MEAEKAFMNLAENTKIENSIIHYDLIDAMIRQPSSSETKPFKIHNIPGDEILAVNYDIGNDGAAYPVMFLGITGFPKMVKECVGIQVKCIEMMG